MDKENVVVQLAIRGKKKTKKKKNQIDMQKGKK